MRAINLRQPREHVDGTQTDQHNVSFLPQLLVPGVNKQGQGIGKNIPYAEDGIQVEGYLAECRGVDGMH